MSVFMERLLMTANIWELFTNNLGKMEYHFQLKLVKNAKELFNFVWK